MKWVVPFFLIIALFIPSHLAFAENSNLFISTLLETSDSDEEILLNNNMEHEEENEFILRNRYAEIDKAVLNQPTMVLNLFDDIKVTAIISRKEIRSKNRYSLFGTVPSVLYSSVYFVVDGDKVTGNINLGDQLVHIRWMGAKVHSISEIDVKNLPQSGDPVTPTSRSVLENNLSSHSDDTPSAAVISDDGSTIDVLVVYTQAAAANGDIHSEIQLAVDHMNTALTNSDIDLRMNLVHTAMVDYYETGNALTDLNRISTAGDGYMDGVLSLRNHYGADLVALVTESMNSWCGLGMLNGAIPDQSAAFHVTRRSCLTYGTFAHEVGHNLGMAHEKYQSPTGGAYSYSHGYVDLVNRFRTIMSYGSECTASGYSCPRIDYYSAAPTSGIQYNSNNIGDATDADNRQTAIYTKTAISQFRQSRSASDEDVSAGCFIATAAYGTYLSPKVSLLRKFRDTYLKTNPLGRAIVNFYYKISPPIAHVIGQNGSLRAITRTLLMPLLFVIEYFWIAVLILIGFTLMMIYRKKIGTSFLKLIVLTLVLSSIGLSNSAKAQVAYPSLFSGEAVRNPAILMEKEKSLAGYQKISEKGETETINTTEKEELILDRTRAFFFFKSDNWAANFSTTLSDLEKIENNNTSSSSVNSGSNTYEKNSSQTVISVAGKILEELNIGGRLETLKVENDDFNIEDSYQILGFGLNYIWQEFVFVSAGGNYTQAYEDEKVDNAYIDYYIGVAMTQEFMKDTTFHLEYSNMYSPEDGQKSSGDKAASYHRKTQENYIVAEAIYNEKLFFMYRIYEKEVSALSTRSEESKEKTTVTSVGFGYTNDKIFAELLRTITERKKGSTTSDLNGTHLTVGVKF